MKIGYMAPSRARAMAISRLIELRLEESKTLVEMMDTKYAREQMLQIAKGYSRLAERLELPPLPRRGRL